MAQTAYDKYAEYCRSVSVQPMPEAAWERWRNREYIPGLSSGDGMAAFRLQRQEKRKRRTVVTAN
ncbi:MAG: hypothetical protein WAL71_09285 [Terriglobales bacterium]